MRNVILSLLAAGALLWAQTRAHYLLQFPGRPGPEVKRELAARGIVVTGDVPGKGIIVSAPEGVNWGGLGIRAAGRLGATQKISPLLESRGTGSYVVEFHRDVVPARMRTLVRAARLDALTRKNLLPTHLLVTGPLDRVRALAENDEVAYVFPASDDLLSDTPVMVCPGPLSENGPLGQFVKASPGWPSNTPDGVTLSYVFAGLTAKLPADTQESEILRAFQEWAKYAPLTFTVGDSATGSRTVAILFARGAHGDGYPFDGPNGILAHTFYPAPPNSEPIAGDLHLDDDENWQIGSGTDLYTVALHEIGHALGLGHSDLTTSVMYPYYRFGMVLSDDDIAGIRSIYGSRDDSTPQTPQNPQTPSTPSVPTGPTSTPQNPNTPTQTPTTPTTGASSDTTPPDLHISSPSLTIVSTSADSISFRGTATDNSGVAQVTWSNSTGGSGTASGTTSWSAEIPLLSGTNLVTIRAFDAAGNSGWRAVTVVRR